MTDMLVWVLDPQKYADAAIYDRYLTPLVGHQEIMLVALNHIDEVPVGQRDAMVADVERLLGEHGLGSVPVVAISAKHGDGISELKKLVAERVAAKKATSARLMADVASIAARLAAANGSADPQPVGKARRSELVSAFADAAGVPVVVDAVEQATRVRAPAGHRLAGHDLAEQAAARPAQAAAPRPRPGGKELTGRARASLPAPTPVQRARVDTAVRTVSDDVTAGLPHSWSSAVRRASVSRFADLNDALDAAVAGADLGVGRTPLWWQLVRVLQWLLLTCAVVGGVWLAALAVMGYLQLPEPTTPTPVASRCRLSCSLGGIAAGLLLAAVCRVLVRWSARSRARAADRRIRAAMAEVADRLVLEPIDAEVAAYRTTRDGLAVAAG